MCLSILLGAIGVEAASYPVYEDIGRQVRDADPRRRYRGRGRGRSRNRGGGGLNPFQV